MHEAESRLDSLRENRDVVRSQIMGVLTYLPSPEANLLLKSLMQEWKALTSEMNYRDRRDF